MLTKVDLHTLIGDPIIRGFTPASRCHIWEFIELSVRYDPPGIVEFYDDAVAATLRMQFPKWLRLRDAMISNGLIRCVKRPGANGQGRRIYEVAPWLLPLQDEDGRSQDPWTDPDINQARSTQK